MNKRIVLLDNLTLQFNLFHVALFPMDQSVFFVFLKQIPDLR